MRRQKSIRSFVFINFAVCLSACAGSGPYRNGTDEFVSQSFEAKCQDLYKDTDNQIRQISTDFSKTDDERAAFLATTHDTVKSTPEALQPCLHTAYEQHQDAKYKPYYAEFDDARQPTDIAKNTFPYNESQLHLIETSLLLARLRQHPNEGLNIVVFTHGWHGNDCATNDYSTEFKAILQDIALREQAYADRLIALPAANRSQRMPHPVLWIEVAWRGDSFLAPALPFLPRSKNVANVWDGKLKTDTVSIGLVQALLAFLNEIYLDNSCHGPRPNPHLSGADCDRVHLLSIGHSFGALINFRALTPRLESGLNVEQCFRVYGFGDKTIVLDPAFEGARYRALFNNALHSPVLFGPYLGDDIPSGQCGVYPPDDEQIPSIVILQSLGDTATGTFFPIFRAVTTPFAQTLSDQEGPGKNDALGWVVDFRTYTLTLTLPPTGATADDVRTMRKAFVRSGQAQPHSPSDSPVLTSNG